MRRTFHLLSEESIDPQVFSRNITEAGLNPAQGDDVHSALKRYTEVLEKILDQHAPEENS